MRWAVLPSNGKLPVYTSKQMQACSVMEVFILVFPDYTKIMVPLKCDHYATNTYSGDSYLKNNHEEEVLETFMSRIIISWTFFMELRSTELVVGFTNIVL